MRKKRIIVSVSNDLVTDQRVRKQCNELVEAGYEILLLGRFLSGSLVLERTYQVYRANLPFRKGALFYASLNIFLFFKILFSKCDILWANDLDTLPANWLASLFRGKTLIYDSHEYFTEVPEIQYRPWVKRVWQFFERTCIQRAQMIMTVSPSIGELLKSTYHLSEVLIVRNVPEGNSAMNAVAKEELGLNPREMVLLLQGNGININRGGEELVESMEGIENAHLLVIGNGDAMPRLKELSANLNLTDKITFLPRMPYVEMMRYTVCADIGFSLDKNDNINYRFSLPNKIFDYARAGLPMIVSDLPEVSTFVIQNDIGLALEEVTADAISRAVNKLMQDREKLSRFRANAEKIGAFLSWEIEFRPVIDRLRDLNA